MKRMLSVLLTVVMLVGCCGMLTGCKTEISLSDETKTKLDDAVKELDMIDPEPSSDFDSSFSKKKVPAATPTSKPTPTPNAFASPEQTMELNETITIGNTIELTLESVEWADEIYPSAENYTSYYQDKEGQTYFVIHGTMKNLCGEDLMLHNNFLGEMLVNNTYKSSLQAATEEADGRYFGHSIKPLQIADIVIFSSVSDGVYEISEDVTLTLKMINDADYINEYFREDTKPHDTYIVNLSGN